MSKLDTPDPAALSAYERSEVAVRALILFAACLALAIVVAALTAGWLLREFGAQQRAAQQPRHPMAAEREVPPDPRLQISPAVDLVQHREREQRTLSTYGWIDRQAGIVHIPIERAMEAVLERGLVPHAEGKSPHADGETKER